VDVVLAVEASNRLRASSRMRFAGESNVLPEVGVEDAAVALEVVRVMESRREWNFRLVVASASGRCNVPTVVLANDGSGGGGRDGVAGIWTDSSMIILLTYYFVARMKHACE